MIYLAPEIKSSIGDDTFWTWFERTFICSFDIPNKLNDRDVILQYSTMGAPKCVGGKSVALLWELHPDLIEQNIPEGNWHERMIKIRECAQSCNFRTVSSPIMQAYYDDTVVLPIGVDTDLFCPRDKIAARKKWGYDLNARIGFWGGNPHPMKGMDRLQEYQRKYPNIQWIIADKWNPRPQTELAELMNCADFGLFTGRLRSYYMVEWEMMASDLPIIDISGMERDFIPTGRHRVFELGWSRYQAKESWYKFLKNTVGAEVYFK